MKPYIAFLDGKRFELYAYTLGEAKQKAIEHFKPKKSQRHMVHVYLATEEPETT